MASEWSYKNQNSSYRDKFQLHCISKSSQRNFCLWVLSPGGGGGTAITAIYGLYSYVPLWRVWFSNSLLWDMVCKSKSLGLE